MRFVPSLVDSSFSQESSVRDLPDTTNATVVAHNTNHTAHRHRLAIGCVVPPCAMRRAVRYRRVDDRRRWLCMVIDGNIPFNIQRYRHVDRHRWLHGDRRRVLCDGTYRRVDHRTIGSYRGVTIPGSFPRINARRQRFSRFLV